MRRRDVGTVPRVDRDAPAAPDGRLQRLDERLVPALRRAAHATTHVLGAPLRLLTRVEDRLLGGVADFGMRNRAVVAFVAAALLTTSAAVHFQRYPELRDQARAQEAADRRQTVREAGAGEALPGATAVGPTRDVSVDGYLDGWRDTLDGIGAAEERAAVVSFADFVTPEQVADVLPEGMAAELVQYRLLIDGAAPGSGGTNTVTDGAPVLEAEVVRGDVTASVGAVVDELLQQIVQEESELTSMLETTDEPSFRRDFENRLEELSALRSTLASGGRIVFAVVVVGTGDDLRTLAADDAVRVVDVAPADAAVGETEFYGLLPTDERVVTFGAFS